MLGNSSLTIPKAVALTVGFAFIKHEHARRTILHTAAVVEGTGIGDKGVTSFIHSFD